MCPFCITDCGMSHCSYSKNYNQREKKLSTVNYDTGELIKESELHTITKKEEVNVSPTGSLRKNAGKPEVSQLDPRFILALADVMTVSAEKYGKYNWALGQQYHTPFDSAMRHLLAFMNGEDYDKESGKHHLLHVTANMMILWTSAQLNKDYLDTRRKWDE